MRVKGEFVHQIEEKVLIVEFTAEFDPNYGADADGRRGICELIDLDLKITWKDQDITEFLHTFVPEQVLIIDAIATRLAWERKI